MKLQKITGRGYHLTIPVQLIRAKGWKKEDNISIKINSDGDLVLKKFGEKKC